MNQSLDKLESRLEKLREKAAIGGEKAKEGTNLLIAETRESLARLRLELSGVGETTKENWSDFNRSFSRTMGDLGRKIEDAFDG